MFSVISIVNLKLIRKFFYFFKLNSNLKKFKFIFFCYNTKIDANLQTQLAAHNFKFYFLKKLKYNNYLNYIILPYLTNNLVMYCCQDITAIQFLLPHISKTILFSKIDNTFYSLNNIETYLSSTNELYNYLNMFIYQFIFLFQNFSKKS